MDCYPIEQLRQCCRDEEAFQHLLALLAPHSEAAHRERYQALFRVVTNIRETLDLATIFRTAAVEVRKVLDADRVGVFRFDANSGYDDGEFVSEDVISGYRSVLAVHVHDHCFGERYSLEYLQGRVQAVPDIYRSGLQDCHIQVLSQFQIRANLIVPILRGEHLWGLFCIHQCSGPRHWQSTDVELVQQVATQLSIAVQQAELLEQTQQQAIELANALYLLKQLQTQLVQQEKMSGLGQLVAGIAHEINNPVNFIYGNLDHAHHYAQTLLEVLQRYQAEHPTCSQALSDRLHDMDLEFIQQDFPRMLASMQIGADRIRQLVLSLRNFSRLDEADMKWVNLHDGLDSTLVILQNRLKPHAGLSGIDVVKEYGDLPLVECYASQINQVFMNILCNAIDAFEDGPRSPRPIDALPQIVIRTRLAPSPAAPPRVMIAIADNGPGIPENIHARLFDPFFTTKPVNKGTGLGLSISHQIVTQRHQGTLSCYSTPGKGTEFLIDIPLAQPNAKERPNPPYRLL